MFHRPHLHRVIRQISHLFPLCLLILLPLQHGAAQTVPPPTSSEALREAPLPTPAIPADLTPVNFTFYGAMPFIRRSRDLDTSGAWIDRANPMLKFFVRRDGMHKITRDFLVGAGVDPATLDPSTMALYRKGRQVALYPVGMEDGRFDEADYLLFIGQRNRDEGDYRAVPLNPDSLYPQYLDKYTDSCAYFLRFGVTNPLRITNAPASSAPSKDSLTWHVMSLHLEEDNALTFLSQNTHQNLNPEWTIVDSWIMNSMQPGNLVRKALMADNIIPNRICSLLIRMGSLQGKTNVTPNHRVRVRFTSTTWFDSLTFNTNQQVVMRSAVPSNYVKVFPDTLHVESVNVQQGYSSLYLDWIDLDYPRWLVARQGQLQFSIDPSMPRGPRNIAVRTIAAAGRVDAFRTRNGGTQRITSASFLPDTRTLVAIDSVTEGDEYLFVAHDSCLIPTSPSMVRFSADRTPQQQGRYVMLAPQKLLTEARDYCSFVANAYATTAVAVPVETLYDEYAFGNYNPEVIKLFVLDAMVRWRQAQPLHLALCGDANLNMKARTGDYRETLVPTYGVPSTDLWFVCFDSAFVHQSLYVGRIPVRTGAELAAYRDRHQRHLTQKPDMWTKSLILFSGGEYFENDQQLQAYQDINRNVISLAVTPAPFAGRAQHFYKTAVPPTNFGPFTSAFVQSVMDEGALAISFSGHSASTLWDNSITDPAQLYNVHQRGSLITDFGCASAQFALPDVMSFGERNLVTPSAQALAYIGNTTFGYLATMSILPPIFYGALLRDGHPNLGQAHAVARRRLLGTYGEGPMTNNTAAMSELLGDPIITLQIPQKVELAARREWIAPQSEIFTDAMDTLRFRMIYANFGKSVADTFSVRIEDRSDTTNPSVQFMTRRIPGLLDTLFIAVPSNRITGTRHLTVTLDAFNSVVEDDKTNNTADYQYEVLSTLVSIVNADAVDMSLGWRNHALLNPLLSPGPVNNVIFEFDTDPAFPSPVRMSVPYGKTVTRLGTPPALQPDRHHFWRAILDAPDQKYIGPFQAWSGDQRAPFVQRDSLSFIAGSISNGSIDSAGVTLRPPQRAISVVSAGTMDGNLAAILVDGVNVLGTNAIAGYGIAAFDATTMRLKEQRIFLTNVTEEEADSMAAFIGRATSSDYLVITAGGDPRRNRDRFAAAFRALGARRIDSLADNASYMLAGRPGAAPGSAVERWLARGLGRVQFDSVYAAQQDTVVIKSPLIGTAAAWRSVYAVHASTNPPAQLFKFSGLDSTGTAMFYMERRTIDSIDIATIDARQFPMLSITTLLLPGISTVQPRLGMLGVDYLHLPELAFNYQSLSMAEDTVDMAQSNDFALGILNAGEVAAPPVPVDVELLTSDNRRVPLAAINTPTLAPNAWFDTTITVPGLLQTGRQRVICRMNANQVVKEQFTTNNTYVLAYEIRRDTTRPTLTVTLDRLPPIDMDFVRPTPEIHVTLSSKYGIITEQDRFTLRLNDTLITPGDPRVIFTPGTGSAPAELHFTPELVDGIHELAVNGRDNFNNSAFDVDYRWHVQVNHTPALREIMNYPNPSSGATAFTWIATGEAPPEEVTVKIFTVSGRLIRLIRATEADLRLGFDSLPWDGRDEDGDLPANGVYFYKVISRIRGQQFEYIGKLAVLR